MIIDSRQIAIVGGGPAGLIAAEVLLQAGFSVDLFDAMPSLGRKFLLAGKGGLNLTHSEPLDAVLGRYGTTTDFWRPKLQRFGPAQLRAWAAGLGVTTFVGSSGRVFPKDMKAAPLLRAWLHRLRALGLRIHTRHRLSRIVPASGARYSLQFDSSEGKHCVLANNILLALGGASWPQLGSDGAWVGWLQDCGVPVAPLRAANCGFDVARLDDTGHIQKGWSEHFRSRFAGAPLKGVRLCWQGAGGERVERIGEFVITDGGIEGSLVYAASRDIRETIQQQGQATVELDLLAQRDIASVQSALQQSRGSRSLSKQLKSRLDLYGVKASLLYELLAKPQLQEPLKLAAAIKALPLRLQAARPVAEAISTAGGVKLSALDDTFMIRALPGVYCAGEMLDWEAPTGGYLLTASFASGVAAAQGLRERLSASAS